MQGVPVSHGLIPQHAFGGVRTATQVLNGLLVHSHHARTRPGFNCHIAHRHAAFHGQGTNRRAAKFNGIACATGSPDLTDHVQDQVFGGTAKRQLAVHLDQHAFAFLHQQGLGGQRVLNFRSADTKGQGTYRTVRAGVRVTTNHGHARQGSALLGANNVHNALTHIVHAELGNAKFFAVGVQGINLQTRDRVCNTVLAGGGGNVVVRHSQVGTDAPRLAAGQCQTFKGLGAGHFMQQVAINVDQTGAIRVLMHDVFVEQLIV